MSLKNNPIHPFIFGVYPILALMSSNITQIPFSSGLRAIVFSILIVGLTFWVFKLVLQDTHRAAMSVLLVSVLLLSYGHVYNTLKPVEISQINIGRHRYLGPVLILLLFLGMWGIIRLRIGLENLTGILNLVSACIVVWPFFQILNFYARNSQARTDVENTNFHNLSSFVGDIESLPDIYFIMLDGYSRDDLLMTEYGFDNTPFIENMEKLGFFNARCSQSNYSTTDFSLSSVLNMDYFETYRDQIGEDGFGFGKVIKNSQVQEILEDFGYRTVAFETGFYWTQLDGADIYLSPQEGGFTRFSKLGGLNKFEVLYLQTTALKILTDAIEVISTANIRSLEYPRHIHRERVLFIFDQLETMPSVPGPKYVFAHIVSPHEPYIFDSSGSLPPDPGDGEKKAAYIEQTIYLNTRLEQLVKVLINDSDNPPIIILQSDHSGVRDEDRPELRVQILNLLYLPGVDDQILFETITPVNTFRLIFDHYFDMNFPLLEDSSNFVFTRDPISQLNIPLSDDRCRTE